MPRAGEDLVRWRSLDDLAGVHDGDPVADLGDDAEVVRDQEDRETESISQRRKQTNDLDLDRDVERGRRLVGDQQLGRARESERDHRALRHPARQLVRIGAVDALRRRQTDRAEQIERTRLRLTARAALVCPIDLLEHRADARDRIEEASRVLEDHRDLRAADRTHLALGEREQVAALEQNLPADDASRRPHEPGDRVRGDRLPRARLPHEPEHLAANDVARPRTSSSGSAFIAASDRTRPGGRRRSG